MTAEELIIELYQASGNRDQYYPYDSDGDFDITTDGAVEALSVLNRAQRQIARWKFKDGHVARFDCLRRETPAKLEYTAGTEYSADANATTSVVYVPGLYTGSVAANAYANQRLEITDGPGEGQVRLIARSAEVTTPVNAVALYPAKAFDTAPDATSKVSVQARTLTMSELDFDGLGYGEDSTKKFLGFLKITDLTDESVLEEARRIEDMSIMGTGLGTPSQWLLYGQLLWFDEFPNKDRWYRIEYMAVPDDMSGADDYPNIPSNYDEALLMWAVWWTLVRQGESDDAWARKNDLKDCMESTAEPQNYEADRGEYTFVGDNYGI